MKQTITLLIGLALAGSALTVSAQQGQGRGAGVGGPHRCGAQMFPPPIAAILDTEKVGSLTSAEINGAPVALNALDKNSDGQVNAEEIQPLRGAGGGCPWAQNQTQ
jgi:hypothetical protein